MTLITGYGHVLSIVPTTHHDDHHRLQNINFGHSPTTDVYFNTAYIPSTTLTAHNTDQKTTQLNHLKCIIQDIFFYVQALFLRQH